MESNNFKKIKQNFLRINVIEKLYDSQDFSAYMQKKKLNGTDIDNWTFTELEEVVRLYKSEPRIFFKRSFEKNLEEL